MQLAGGIIAAVALAAGCSSASNSSSSSGSSSQGSSPIYIGSVLGVSGAFASFDVPEEVGIQVAVNEINASGGVLGHKLVYVNIDDTSDPTKAAAATQQLLSEHKYVAVWPDPVPYDTILNYTNAEHIITFGAQGATAADEFNPTKYPYDFNDSAPQPVYQAHVASEILAAGGGKGHAKLAVIENAQTATESEVQAMETSFTSQGGQVVSTQPVPGTPTDVTIQLEKAKAAGANVVYFFSNAGLCSAGFNGLATLNWGVKAVGGADCVAEQTFQAIPASEKANVSFIGFADDIIDPATNGPNAKVASFASAVLKADSNADIAIAAIDADSVRDLVWAITKAGTATDESAILNAMNSFATSQVPASTWIENPNPMWSSTDHTMDKAQFPADYYGLITPGAQVSGTYPGTVGVASAG